MSANDVLYTAIESSTKAFFGDLEEAIRVKNTTILSRTLAPDCSRSLAPESLIRTFGMPEGFSWTNEAYEQHMKPEVAIMEHATYEILFTAVDSQKRKSVARVAHHTKLRGKDAVRLEIVWFLDWNEDGSKVKKIAEFVDTAESIKIAQSMKESVASLPSELKEGNVVLR
ncbi:hypothetical protein DFH08DRAFT_888609 [Mycena albidolilacea]|uniref:Uncharacterized protein n=1 Tax=Mycena albidolilacea TaxID=1033008 RepID=A0AAD6ZIB7_9AGAR|nr:hypothetical protein DFH08DRAFT_888609 [Mycena albidolilacea]